MKSLFIENKQEVRRFFVEAPRMELPARLAYFDALFPFAHTLSASLYMIDANHIAIACNPYQLEIYGRKIALQDSLNIQLPVLAERLGWDTRLAMQWQENNRHALETGMTMFSEAAAPTGQQEEIISKKDPVYDDNGKPLGIIGFGIPVSHANKKIVKDKNGFILTLSAGDDVKLTQREFSMLQALLNGMSAAQMGKRFRLSPKTVETHLAHIKLKFGCTKLREIYPFLMRHQLAHRIIEFVQQ